MKTIASIKIHPAIGIARVGNSPTEFFIGPEKPGVHQLPRGGYRDAKGRIKRQAARFRLFGYDKNGKVVKELTSADAKIEWTVHLANKKAEWKRFEGLDPNAPRRNNGVSNRSTLIIDPGPRSIQGPNKKASFDTGKFRGVVVPLGEIRSDSKARLLVLGGFGHSASPDGTLLTTFANNDGWHDDVSDGPVNARITLTSGGMSFDALGAWVIVAAPKYAPAIDNIITLYDALLQRAVDQLGLKLPAKPSFTRDIYPMLQRAIRMKWVSGMVSHPMEHADQKEPSHSHQHGDMEGPAHATLHGVIPPPASAAARLAIFNKLRDPATPGAVVSEPADMPMIHSDFYPAESNQPLTKVQYEMMRKWKDGDFISDWSGPPAPSRVVTPEGLDRAALEPCVGGPLYPGIEASWLLRDVYEFSEPFRLNQAKLKAGDITKQMAVPWQSDFADCRQEGELAWWPSQHPDEVFLESTNAQVEWTREIGNGRKAMVDRWHKLGFVVKKGARYVETERNP
jgi:hypothetical protein